MPYADPEKAKARQKKYYEEHKEEILARNKKYYEEHKEEIRASWEEYYYGSKREKKSDYDKKRYSENREEIRALQRVRRKFANYSEGHKEHLKAKSRAWYQANKEQARANNRDAAKKMRMDVLQHYGGKCKCCGETTYEFLAIDHVNNDGAEHRRSLGYRVSGKAIYYWLRNNNYPEGFQVLWHNCNMAKGLYGSCPHQRKEGQIGSK